MVFYNVYAVDMDELVDTCNDDTENQVCDGCGWYNDECHCDDDDSLDEDYEDE